MVTLSTTTGLRPTGELKFCQPNIIFELIQHSRLVFVLFRYQYSFAQHATDDFFFSSSVQGARSSAVHSGVHARVHTPCSSHQLTASKVDEIDSPRQRRRIAMPVKEVNQEEPGPFMKLENDEAMTIQPFNINSPFYA